MGLNPRNLAPDHMTLPWHVAFCHHSCPHPAPPQQLDSSQTCCPSSLPALLPHLISSHLSVSPFLPSFPPPRISPSPFLCLRQACHLGSLTRAGTLGGRQEEGVLGHSEEPSDSLWGEPHIPQGQKETCYQRCGPETASVPSHLQTLKDKTALAGTVEDPRSQGGSPLCSQSRLRR